MFGFRKSSDNNMKPATPAPASATQSDAAPASPAPAPAPVPTPAPAPVPAPTPMTPMSSVFPTIEEDVEYHSPSDSPEVAPETSSRLQRSNSLMSLLPTATIGILEDNEVEEDLAHVRRIRIKDSHDTKMIEEAFQEVVDCVETLTVKARDNDVILYQMLDAMEERLKKRINEVKEELLVIIDNKIAAIPASGPPATAVMPVTQRPNTRSSIYKPPTSNPSLHSLLTEEESNSRRSSLEPAVIYEDKEILPIPGFVIKTKKLVGNKDKVFINVFHHEKIDVIPAMLPEKEKATAMENLPFLIMGTVSNSLDKEGQNCVTYNVGVSSEFFKQPSTVDFTISTPPSIQKIIHKINLKHSDFLDESSYSLPRLAQGYKGENIPLLKVPLPAQKIKPVSIHKVFSSDDTMSVSSETPERRLSNSSDAFETGSVAMSQRSGVNGGKRRMQRKSIFDSSGHAMNYGNVAGRNMLSGNMLEYIKEDSVDGKTAQSLKDQSIDNQFILLGWQIQFTADNGSNDLYVVTDVRKNLMSKTEYRLSKFNTEDMWVKLKRSGDKGGNDFRPMRKVLFGLQDDEDQF